MKKNSAAVMAAWGAWYEKLGAAVIDPGNPFGGVKNVRFFGGQ